MKIASENNKQLSALPGTASVISLLVQDVKRSCEFYEGLGWVVAKRSRGLVLFKSNGFYLGLFARGQMSSDLGIDLNGSGQNALFSTNVARRSFVDEHLQTALSLGAMLVKGASETPWGGMSAFYKDLDKNLWEVTWNPHVEIGKDGAIVFN